MKIMIIGMFCAAIWFVLSVVVTSAIEMYIDACRMGRMEKAERRASFRRGKRHVRAKRRAA